MADKNFIVKNGLEVGGQEVVSSSGVVTSAALGGQTLASTDSPTFANLTLTNDIEVGGDLNLTGDLNITGDVNSLSVTDLDVTDQTITLGAGQVESASGGSGIIVDGSGASILWDETNDTFDINKGLNVDSDTFVVDNTNNRVGIGTSSPAKTLHLTAGSSVIRLEDTDGGYGEVSGSNGNIRLRADEGNTQASSFMSFDIDSTEEMRLTSTGLGIGTISPDTKLHLSGADNEAVVRLENSSTDLTEGDVIGALEFYKSDASGAGVGVSGSLKAVSGNVSGAETDLIFGTSSTARGNNAEIMRLTGDGNVGIGTDNPQSKLQIQNSTVGTPASTVAAGTEAGIYLEDSNTPTGRYFVSKTHNTGNGNPAGGIKFVGSPDATNYSWSGILGLNSTSGNVGELAFYTSASNSSGNSSTEHMRITSTGNIGIGTSDPTRRLTLSGTSTEYINIVGGTSSGVGLLLGDTDAEIRGAVIYDNSNDTLVFRAGGNVTRALVGSNRFEIDPTNDRYKFAYDGNSYNEGLRMAPHSNGFSVLVLGAGTGDSGTVEGQWTLARHPDSDDNKLTLRYFDTSDFIWEILKTGEVGFGGTPAAGVTGAGLKLETIEDTNSAYTSTGSTGRLPDGLQISTRNFHNANDSLSGIAMQSSGSGGGTMGGYIGMLPSSTYSSPKMVFGLTSGSSAWREDIRILGVDGTKRHVGIGNINPSEELHVSTTTGGVTRIRIDSTSSARNNYIGCTNYDELVLAADEDNEGLNSEIAFRVDGTEKLKINDDGNLGLGGINPGNWNSIWQVIEGGLASNYAGFVAFQTNANDMKLGTNVYHDGSFRYRHDGNGIFVELNREDFVINFLPTGTADSVISFDEAFRLNKTTGVDFVVKRIHLTQTADQSITEGGTIYANFGSQSHIDTDTFTHSTSTNSDNITVDRAGLYQIIGNFVFINAAASARNTVRVSVRVNGVTQNTTASFDYDRGSSYGEFSNNKINTIIDLNANDVIDFEVFGQNIDGTCSLDASFTEVIMTRIGKSG